MYNLKREHLGYKIEFSLNNWFFGPIRIQML